MAKNNRKPHRSASQSPAVPNKRTAIYARVSTNGQSTESQISDLRAYMLKPAIWK